MTSPLAAGHNCHVAGVRALHDAAEKRRNLGAAIRLLRALRSLRV